MHSLQIIHLRQSGTDLQNGASFIRLERGEHEYADTDTESDSDTGSHQDPDLDSNADLDSDSDAHIDLNTTFRFRKNFHKLAQWAFGPQGFTSLRLIAYGDFSYDGRYALTNLFLARNVGQLRYKVYSQNDLMGYNMDDLGSNDERCLSKLIERHFEMLSACPVDPLIEV
jgi:hypothetical protein